MSDPSSSPDSHQPYVPDDVVLPEFTWSAVLVGAVLGIIFGASSLYLVLKVGMTVSASIPVAVLSITLFRGFSRIFGVRQASILENNIVQTTGSAGESIAFGVGVTMPAVMILGFEMEITRVMVVSVLGGLLGILMMIPLRRAFIVKQHGTLKYPEGTACADVLMIGETGGATAKTVFAGFGIAFVYQFLMLGLKLWKDTISHPLGWLKGATPALEANPALLGVGYIIGVRISSTMVAGGVLAWLVLCPAIMYFGAGLNQPLAPGTMLIRDMDAEQLRYFYVLYIGAGAVAAGGIISMGRALPLILASIRAGLRDMRSSSPRPLAGEGQGVRAGNSGQWSVASGQCNAASDKSNPQSPIPNPSAASPHPNPLPAGEGTKRTDHDISMRTVLFGSLLLVLGIWAFLAFDPQSGGGWSMGGFHLVVALVAAVLIVLFGFLFVTVSSRLTGEIGSSSNPISGMTVATLLLTCLIFLAFRLTSPQDQLIALSVAAVVCIASSNGGTTSQDLKTGFLVGATPKWQQLSIVVGSLSSALVIGVILLALNQAGTIYSRKNLSQPKQALNMPVLKSTAARESAPNDPNSYYVWHPTEGNAEGVPPGKYLVNDQGKICWLVDPGINGKLTRRDDGTEVKKLSPPQAELFALITHGILNQKLPWVLVLFGVLLAIVMELCGVSSLPFAVGVYLPLSSTTPIFVGGLVRYMVERFGRRKGDSPLLPERPEGCCAQKGTVPFPPAASELESEMSPGVLLSTGYIAGGTIAGVLIAMLTFPVFDKLTAQLAAVGSYVPHQSITALVTFLLLAVFLAVVGRGWMMKSR